MYSTFSLNGGFGVVTVFISTVVFLQGALGADFGSINCTNGAWIPDAKIIGFGLSCPLPLDGTSKSKGKTAHCALKKLKLYDGKTTKKDQIAPEFCQVFKQEQFENQCKKQIATCLKNGKGYFQDPKTDTDYKTWSPPFECMEKWVKDACKK